jgi:hypothetical protein
MKRSNRRASTLVALPAEKTPRRRGPSFRAGILPAVLHPVVMFANLVAVVVATGCLGGQDDSGDHEERGKREKNIFQGRPR